MDDATVKRLQSLVPQFQKFLQLHPDEQQWLFPLLGRAEQRTLLILKALQGDYLTYEEIGEKTCTHPSTVKQTLYALDKGGMNFLRDSTGRYATPRGGRKRKLILIGKENNGDD